MRRIYSFLTLLLLASTLSCVPHYTPSVEKGASGGRGAASVVVPAPSRDFPSGLDRLGTPPAVPSRPAEKSAPPLTAPPVLPPGNPGSVMAFDRNGNSAWVAPNRSGSYLGFDGQGNGVMITPLRPGGSVGIDNQGNTWTLPPVR